MKHSHTKVYFQELIDGLDVVKHYLEERLQLVQDIHEGALKLQQTHLVDSCSTEAVRVQQSIKVIENQIEMHTQDMKACRF